MDRVHRFEGRISVLLILRVSTAFFWLSLLGQLRSVTDVIPLGRLHLRPLQLYMLAHWAPASNNLKALIRVKHDLLDHHLRWWLDRKCTRAGMLLDIPDAQANLFTDASKSGWGAHLDALQVSGQWSTRETLLHINHLRTLAVRNALLAFKGAVGRYDSTTHVRQRTRRIEPNETGRYGVCASLSPRIGSSSPGTGCTDHLAGQTHSGRKECLSTPSLQDAQSGSHRVDSKPIGGGFTVHHTGQAQCLPPG